MVCFCIVSCNMLLYKLKKIFCFANIVNSNLFTRNIKTHYSLYLKTKQNETKQNKKKIIDFPAAFATTKKRYGRIDIVCNNAGILHEGRWEQMLAVNMVSADNITKKTKQNKSAKNEQNNNKKHKQNKTKNNQLKTTNKQKKLITYKWIQSEPFHWGCSDLFKIFDLEKGPTCLG